MKNKPLSNLENIKAITDFIIENNLSLEKVMDVYNQFNNRVYNNCINKGGGVKSDNSDLENEALLLTKRYFNIQKIRELKK